MLSKSKNPDRFLLSRCSMFPRHFGPLVDHSHQMRITKVLLGCEKPEFDTYSPETKFVICNSVSPRYQKSINFSDCMAILFRCEFCKGSRNFSMGRNIFQERLSQTFVIDFICLIHQCVVCTGKQKITAGIVAGL